MKPLIFSSMKNPVTQWMRAIACFSMFSITQAITPSLSLQSYSQAAKQLVPGALAELTPLLKSIERGAMPHDIKQPLDLRKEVLRVRDYLDLFAYAMPKAKKKEKDTFERLRKDLDEGYEVMGAYKDLFDIQTTSPENASYNKSELKKRREAMLDWLELFLEREPRYLDYLHSIDNSMLHDRDSSQLSSFYWGATELKPHAALSAKDNLNLLLKDVLQLAIHEWPLVRKISNPARDTYDIEVFHDFRKRVRTMVKMITYFPELVPWSKKEVRFLKDVTKRYGEISNQIARLMLAQEKGKKETAKKLKEETKQLWQDLQEWETQQNVAAKLAALQGFFP